MATVPRPAANRMIGVGSGTTVKEMLSIPVPFSLNPVTIEAAWTDSPGT